MIAGQILLIVSWLIIAGVGLMLIVMGWGFKPHNGRGFWVFKVGYPVIGTICVLWVVAGALGFV
jgi:hypothetical protein